MRKNKNLPNNPFIIISIGLAVISALLLWQNSRQRVYEIALEKNIYLLNENLLKFQERGNGISGAQNDAADYLKWKFVLKEQIDQTAQIFTDKASALKNAGKDKQLAALLYYNLGLAQTMGTNFGPAIEAFEESIALDPRLGYSYYNLGILYSTYIGNLPKAVSFYKKYLEVFPKGLYAGVVTERIKQLERLRP